MFGVLNVTKISFVGKVGEIGLEFTLGLLEEVTFNFTAVANANAAEIPEATPYKFISEEEFIMSTSTIVGSKIAQTKLLELIAGATPNLIL